MKFAANKTIYILVLTILILASSCKKEASNEGQIISNVSYGSASLQNMDVYLPVGTGETKVPIMIMVHGGSWYSGDKMDFDSSISSIRALLPNYAIVNINYRLSNGTTILYQQQIDDITAAINFLGSKSNEYSIDTSKIGLMGASAGAHLVLLKAYKEVKPNIKAIVDLFGPTDLTWMYNNHPYASVVQPIMVYLTGTTPSANAAIYAQGSPINYVSSSVPPTIIFHGTADPVVPISESEKLKAALQTAGVTHQYTTYVGEEHGWYNANLTDTYNKATNFIKLYVK